VQLTLARALDPATAPAASRCPEGYATRPCDGSDVTALAALFFASCQGRDEAVTRQRAEQEMRASFDGEFGELWLEASLVAHDPAGRLVSSIQVVRRAPWADTPPGPFVIELFTAPAARRQGLGRRLLTESLRAVSRSPAAESVIGLRVESENTTAVTLYRRVGFTGWAPSVG
jgi:ribosomal protein S18 acetylase RimI-like enzyme